MEDNKRFDLLYTPELKPDRNYRSEAKFDKKQPRHITPPPEEPTLEDHIEELKELEELIEGLPQIYPIKDLTVKLRQRAEIIKEEEEILGPGVSGPEEPWGPTPGATFTPEEEIDVPIVSNVPADINLPENIPLLFSPPSSVTVTVQTPKTLIQMSQDAYKQDQLDLQKDYLRKIRFTLQKYFTNQLALTFELNTGDIDTLTKDFDGDAVTGVSANLQHLKDTIVRSQIERNQKKRFFDKMINPSNTLQYMRMWNAAEKSKERYYGEAYGDSSNFIDSESNALLREARASYEARYRDALYNMYKYLDSAAQMTEDILDHISIESKAKAKLLKENVDIYKSSADSQKTGTGTTAVQAYSQEQLKSLEDARARNNSITTDISKLSTEEKDKVYDIKTPASESEWGLAPTGSHWDMEDINNLISNDPNTYSTRTSEGKEAIKVALSLMAKYIKAENSSNKNSESTSSSIQDTSNKSKSEEVSNQSKSEIQKIMEMPGVILH